MRRSAVLIFVLGGVFGGCAPMSSKPPPPSPPVPLHGDCGRAGAVCETGLYCYTRETRLGGGFTTSTGERDPGASPPPADEPPPPPPPDGEPGDG